MKKKLPFLALVLAACGGRANDLPPHGEALVVVDTDLPVPQLASRLRVDLFDEDGRWFESRDIGRTDARDWPASFSVYSDDDTREKRVLVRLRVYPDGITRDYKGERFEARPDYHAPIRPKNVDEMCANAPELLLGDRVALHLGSKPITDTERAGSCTLPTVAGSAAARVVIGTAGRYRFDVADAFPYATYVSLALRSACADSNSQLACELEPMNGTAVFTPGHFPRFDVRLDPGTYFLVASGVLRDWPADITLEGMPIDAPLPNPTPLTKDPPNDPQAPRLHHDANGPDQTPPVEPLPSAAIDRLLVLRLLPGVRGSAHVTLRGACAGTMARIGEDPSRPAIATATTCIDTENVRVPVVETPLDANLDKSAPSEQGTFGHGDACTAPSREDIACVPPGAFLLGSRLVSSLSSTRGAGVPERIAAMSRFWIDKREFSVARLRAAIARGFVLDPNDIHTNDRAFPGTLATSQEVFCTWSTAPIGREDFPVSCINHRAARDLCRFEGGDLPTDAQWEYAAGAAGRSFQTPYPWGDDPPSCERSVIGRAPAGNAKNCVATMATPARPPGPSPLGAYPEGDVTPLGILAMGGNVQEWSLDSAEAYSSDCWRAASLRDPKCVDADAPLGSIRGGCWLSDGTESVANRNQIPVAMAASGIPGAADASPIAGFRCAYAEEPR